MMLQNNPSVNWVINTLNLYMENYNDEMNKVYLLFKNLFKNPTSIAVQVY